MVSIMCGIGCTRSFIRDFKQRLIDCRWQDWEYHINSSDRFMQYRKIKTSHNLEPYLLMDLNRFVRYTLTRFRFGVSTLYSHCSRYRRNTDGDTECPLCNYVLDNEIHLVLCCPALDDLRHDLIPSKYYNNPCDFRLTLLLASKNEKIIKNLAIFLYKAYNRRDST